MARSAHRQTKPPDVAIVFQSFALFPWLKVLENVEAPLEALGYPAIERRKRALKMLDTVGLDGFETAYPKELSGGMKQRVGFARALVVEPEVLFMDEPFSALDVLTAENLRGELMELWLSKKMPTTAIFIVTHNIEEAVLLADRVIVLGKIPARIRADFDIRLPQPRDRKSASVRRVRRLHLQDHDPAGHRASSGGSWSGLQQPIPRDQTEISDAASRPPRRHSRVVRDSARWRWP